MLALFSRGRQIHRECRSAALIAVQVDNPVMILDRPPNNSHPQAGPAAAHNLLGIKRIKYPLPVFLIDALAGIADLKNHIVALLQGFPVLFGLG